MVYQAQSMRLNEVQLISESEDGKVVICEDIHSQERTRYSVFVTEDHDIIARLHRVYSNAKNISADTDIRYYSDGGKFLVVYPYVAPRPMARFYMGKDMPLNECEDISRNFIIACMTAELPWAVLYLALKQKQINIARDGSVYLSYAIDLSEVDESVGESDCVQCCAKELVEMFSQKPSDLKWNLRELLEKKSEHTSFSTFTELYRDVNVASSQSMPKGFFKKLQVWFEEHRDRLFRILLIISIILAVFTLITLLTNAIFGDVPWLRLFIRSFDRIGLESLVQ